MHFRENNIFAFLLKFRLGLFFPNVTLYEKAVMVQVMAWCRTGSNPFYLNQY